METNVETRPSIVHKTYRVTIELTAIELDALERVLEQWSDDAKEQLPDILDEYEVLSDVALQLYIVSELGNALYQASNA